MLWTECLSLQNSHVEALTLSVVAFEEETCKGTIKMK